MTGRENRTKNLANRVRAFIRRVEFFSIRIVLAQSGDHGSAIDAQIQIRSSWILPALSSAGASLARPCSVSTSRSSNNQTELWAAIEPTQSHQVDGENAEVVPWLSGKEVRDA